MTIEAKRDEELKTLKDIPQYWNCGCCKDKKGDPNAKVHDCYEVEVDLLKEEAIKWIKYYYAERGLNLAIIPFIKAFFNLTEEDLK